MVLHRTTEVPFTLLWELDSTQSRQSQVDVLGEDNCTFKSVTQGELPAYSPFLYFIHISSLMKWADVPVVRQPSKTKTAAKLAHLYES